MSGLLALLDDVAAIAKLAAASVDDIATNAAKAGSKAAGVLIDDAAVTPKYVTGFAPARELPMIARIARGSIINKLVFLLPAALLMSAFAPWLIAPLLLIGGGYLCFEGAEKIVHALRKQDDHDPGPDGSHDVKDPAQLEEQKVKGAIKTDFILSAEIMAIALSTIESDSVWIQGGTLIVVAIMVTAGVYGAVALIVKADDFGLWLSRNANLAATRSFGRGIVRFMPWLLKALTVIGTAAMLWVGGSIIVHSMHEIGWHMPEDTIKAIGASLGGESGFAVWAVKAFIDGVLGFLLGLALMPIGVRVIGPIWASIFGGKEAQAH